VNHMRQNCHTKHRFTVLSMCVCALLAFTTSLNATTTVFVLGNATPQTYLPSGEPSNAVAIPVGPYAGTLTNSSITLFFCLSGNLTSNWDTSYSGGTESAPSGDQQEEAALLASLFLTDAAVNHITLTTSLGSNGYETRNETGPSDAALATFVTTYQGPITMAIWQIMGSLPSDSPYYVSNPDPAAKTFVDWAIDEWKTVQNNTSFVTSLNHNSVVWTPVSGSGIQSFMGAAVFTPEPGTMVLFGTGALLMAFGSIRRLARRPR
jgi:PEP-CTERM motif